MDINKKLYTILKAQVDKIANKYTVIYPYTDIASHVKTGYVIFHPTGKRQIVSRSEKFNNEGQFVTNIIEELEYQIDVVRYVKYEEKPSNAEDVARLLKYWLSTSEALEEFEKEELELLNNWSDLTTDGNYNDLNKWLQRSFFKVKFLSEYEVLTDNIPLEKYTIEVKGV